MLEQTINFAIYEDSDYDFVARFIQDDTDNYVPVQLKEWVPESLNPKESLESVYKRLQNKQYANSGELTIGIYVSRNTTLKPEKIKLDDTDFVDVWLFGACKPDKNRWFICGDVQDNEPRYFEFDYPVTR